MMVFRSLVFAAPLVLVSACSDGFSFDSLRDALRPARAEAPVEPAAASTVAPPAPMADARTIDEFDTTTEADRAAATASEGGDILGDTTATLGDPTLPGFWLETPLVSEVAQGRVSYQGRWIAVELRPSGGAAGSGSRLSLAAMRLLNAPLTEIIGLRVSRD